MKHVPIGLAGLVLAAMLGGCAPLPPRQAADGPGDRREDAALTTPGPIGGTVDSGGVLAGPN